MRATKGYNMFKRAMVIMALALWAVLAFTVPVTATTEHCPDHEGHPNKVEADNGTPGDTSDDVDLNDIVLDEGTTFCVKGSTDATAVLTADGVTTLEEYLNNGHDVSYYVVYTTPDPAPFVVEVEVDCGSVTARILENNTDFAGFLSGVYGENPLIADYPWTDTAFATDVPEGTDLFYEFDEDENGGEVTVTILAHGPEADAYVVDGKSSVFETVVVDTDCETVVEDIEVIPAVTVIPPTCDADGSFSVTVVEGVTYNIPEWTFGTEFTITTTLAEGYVYADDADESFTITVLARLTGGDCGTGGLIDLDCADFPLTEAVEVEIAEGDFVVLEIGTTAQEALDAFETDIFRLDADGDGVACEVDEPEKPNTPREPVLPSPPAPPAPNLPDTAMATSSWLMVGVLLSLAGLSVLAYAGAARTRRNRM